MKQNCDSSGINEVVGGGGGGAYFAKKIDLSIFIPRLLYVNKQDDMLISDMVSKIINGLLTNSSEHFVLF